MMTINPMNKQTQHHRQQKERVENAMAELVNACNSMGLDSATAEGMLAGLLSQHRTMQQSFVRAIVTVFGEYRGLPCDLRNKAAVEACGAMYEAAKEKPIPFF